MDLDCDGNQQPVQTSCTLLHCLCIHYIYPWQMLCRLMQTVHGYITMHIHRQTIYFAIKLSRTVNSLHCKVNGQYMHVAIYACLHT